MGGLLQLDGFMKIGRQVGGSTDGWTDGQMDRMMNCLDR